jgi:uncharacterized membrane protein
MSTAVLLIAGAELFFINDVFGSRLNTVFKLSYQAWLLLAVSGSFSLLWLLHLLQTEGLPSLQRAKRASLAVAGLVAALALLYPLGATLSRTNNLSAENRTLDGLAFMRRESPDDYAAMDWLRRNAARGERIIEANGGQYSNGSRISARTGIPTLLGWGGHERQWGRGEAEIAQRQNDLNTAFTTTSLAEARAILQQYGVTYVFMGSVEFATYPPAGLGKFFDLPVVFTSGVTSVYRLPAELSESLGRGQQGN